MSIFPSILQMPHRITVVTETDTYSFDGQPSVSFQDVTLGFEQGKVTLQATHTPVCTLRLRWNFPMPQNARMMGDAWERAYGDLEWRGFVPERVMPWYFMAETPQAVAGYGVKTNPDAFCSFACDPN